MRREAHWLRVGTLSGSLQRRHAPTLLRLDDADVIDPCFIS